MCDVEAVIYGDKPRLHHCDSEVLYQICNLMCFFIVQAPWFGLVSNSESYLLCSMLQIKLAGNTLQLRAGKKLNQSYV